MVKKVKGIVVLIFLAGLAAGPAGLSFAYPPYLIKGRKFGAKDCTFCHTHPDGGPPFNERGLWLIGEKERRKAEVVDPEWLAEYKPGSAESPQKTESPPPAPSQGPAAQEVEKEVELMEVEWVRAVKQRDRDRLSALLADDFIATDEHGQVKDKAQYLAEPLGAGPDTVLDSDPKARIHGDVVIASTIWLYKGVAGNDQGHAYRRTTVWRKQGQRGWWQALAVHVSRVQK